MFERDALPDAEREYRARPDDHLVEPMFAGLGVGDDGESSAEEERSSGLFARLLRVLLRR